MKQVELDFEESCTTNEEIVSKIGRRRLQILVHSIIYYKMNDNVVSDATWSHWAVELVELQRKYPNESKKAPMYEMYKDFDGSTGFDLAERADDEAWNKARWLLKWRGKCERGC